MNFETARQTNTEEWMEHSGVGILGRKLGGSPGVNLLVKVSHWMPVQGGPGRLLLSGQYWGAGVQAEAHIPQV